MLPRALALAVLAGTSVLAGAPALAADPQVYSLSPAQRDAAIAAASHNPESTALLPDPERDRILGNSLFGDDQPARLAGDNKVHGEVSMFVGTGGARGIAATIGAPIGENAYAQFSFSQGRLPGQYFGPYSPYRWNQQRR